MHFENEPKKIKTHLENEIAVHLRVHANEFICDFLVCTVILFWFDCFIPLPFNKHEYRNLEN